MKSILSLIVCAFSVLAFASAAQSKTAQANGTFDFAVEGATGSVVFDADGSDSGVTGQMTFNATVDTGVEVCNLVDPEHPELGCVSEPTGETVVSNVAITAQFDCLLVDDNEAAMSGTITSSNTPAYTVGKPVTLFVVDKVDGITPVVDAFAWGAYKPNFKNLTASDYDFCPNYTPPTREELGCDPEGPCDFPTPPACLADGFFDEGEIFHPGATLTWTATDYDLCPAPDEDNPNPPCAQDPNAFTSGIPTIPAAVSCESFPLSAYPLTFIERGHGNKIQVKHNP